MTDLVVDTSAAIAILTGEPTADDVTAELVRADQRSMSAGTLIELGIVLEARIGPAVGGIIERFLRDADIEVVSVDRRPVDRAMEGLRHFGRGRHKAELNFGDLFAYALADSTERTLQYTDRDFGATDLPVVPKTG